MTENRITDEIDQARFFGNSTIKTWKPALPGDNIRGRICEPPRLEQERDIKTGVPLTWPSGDPKMQMVITLQTSLVEDDDDDGRRRVYVNKKGMKNAISDALRASNCKALGLDGDFGMKFTEYGEASAGLSAPKLFSSDYVPPFGVDSFGTIGTAELGDTYVDGTTTAEVN
jgi:hypothetical protein